MTDKAFRKRLPYQRDDDKAQAMYELYQKGHSLQDVGKVFNVTRQSVYEVFKYRDWQIRDRPTPKEYVTYNGQKYTIGNVGYYRATSGDRHLLHRKIWENEHGLIPEGYDIHHIDENKLNNTLENLECLPKAEHTKLHSPSCNQYKHYCKEYTKS